MLVDRQPDGHAWSIALPSSFDEYLAGLSRSSRHRLRRLSRAIAEQGGRWTEVSNQEELSRALPIVEALHQARRRSLGQRGRFESRHFARFGREPWRGNCSTTATSDCCSSRSTGARRRSISPCAPRGTRSATRPASIRRSRDLRVGQVVLAEMIARAIDRGDRILDLGRGDEEYKAHWRAVPVPLESVQISTRHPAAVARFLAVAGFDRFAQEQGRAGREGGASPGSGACDRAVVERRRGGAPT